MALEDVDIHGFGHYRHNDDSVSYMEVRMKIRITNDRDADPPLVEKSFDTIEVTYADMEFDNNKICKYDFVKLKGWEPIKLKAGQHLHMTHAFYHRSTSERFYYGVEGDKFASVENMDMGVFLVKDTRYYTDCTKLDTG